ncbi:MAG: hypothetical protein AB7O52_10095 [Planctomycetota bacterium]
MRESRNRLLVLGVICSISASCDRATPSAQAAARGPEAVAQIVARAICTGNQEAFSECLTEKARSGLAGSGGFSLSSASFTQPVVGAAVIIGAEAVVPLTVTREGEVQEMQLRMKRSQNAWFVYGVSMTPAAGGSEMTVDFEELGEFANTIGSAIAEGMAQAWQEAQQAQVVRDIQLNRAAYDAVKPLTVAEFEASWRNSSDFEGHTAGEALNELAQKLECEFDPGVHGAALATQLTQGFVGKSHLEAFDAICRESGVAAHWPTVDELELAASDAAMQSASPAASGVRVRPSSVQDPTAIPHPSTPNGAPRITLGPAASGPVVTHGGPFRIVVTAVTEQVPHARGSLQITAQSRGLHPAARALDSALGEKTAIQGVVAESGSSLRLEEDVRYLGGSRAVGSAVDVSTTIELKGLLRGVAHVHRLDGVQRVSVPMQVHEVELRPLTSGSKGQAGPLRYEVQQAGTATTIRFEGDTEFVEHLAILCRPLDAEGNDVHIEYADTSSWTGKSANFQLQSAEPPAALMLKVIRTQTIDYPFALRGVPLPRHVEQPEHLLPLTFAGAAPAAVDFVRFDKLDEPIADAVVRVQNQANKAIQSIVVRFTYIDAQGRALEDTTQSLTGPTDFDGQRSVAEPEATATLTTPAFFRPATAQGVRIDTESVEFVDGTRWVAGD